MPKWSKFPFYPPLHSEPQALQEDCKNLIWTKLLYNIIFLFLIRIILLNFIISMLSQNTLWDNCTGYEGTYDFSPHFISYNDAEIWHLPHSDICNVIFQLLEVSACWEIWSTLSFSTVKKWGINASTIFWLYSTSPTG